MVMVMDNVAFHKCANVRTAFEEKGLSFVLLPPYSHFHNPIENFFPKWKNSVRQARCENEDELFLKFKQQSWKLPKNIVLVFIRTCFHISIGV
jgi:transposase